MSQRSLWQESKYNVMVLGVGQAGEKAIYGKSNVSHSQSSVVVQHYASREIDFHDKLSSDIGWLMIIVDLGDTAAMERAISIAQHFRKTEEPDAIVCVTLTQYAATPMEMHIAEMFDKIFFVDCCEYLYEPANMFTAIQYDGNGLIGVCFEDLLIAFENHKRIFLDYAEAKHIKASLDVCRSLLQQSKEKDRVYRIGQNTIAVFGVFPLSITLNDLENVFAALCEGTGTDREIFIYAKTHEVIAEDRILLSVYNAEI